MIEISKNLFESGETLLLVPENGKKLIPRNPMVPPPPGGFWGAAQHHAAILVETAGQEN